jgi:hypothetical protein
LAYGQTGDSDRRNGRGEEMTHGFSLRKKRRVRDSAGNDLPETLAACKGLPVALPKK